SALQHLGRLLHGGEKAEGVSDKRDIAIDGFGYADDGEGVTAGAGLLEECTGATLGAVAADGEEDIDAPADEILHGARLVHGTTRSAENGSGLVMNAVDHLVGEDEGRGAVFRIEALISPAEAEHFFDAIGLVHFEEERADHIVESRTEAATGHDAG